MDWDAAIEKNQEALKRILAALVAMAGLAHGAVAATLPRYLHRAVLRLLRPAEAAARRLIIVAARGIVVELPPPRTPRPNHHAAPPRSLGIAVVVSPADLARAATARRAAAPAPARQPAFRLPLVDPLRTPFRPRRAYVPAHCAPRISTFGATARRPAPAPPSSGDPVDATRLGLRLAALGRALDDMPGQARRFVRWRARRDAGRVRRLGPLKPGNPPGLPRRSARRPHEVHDVLRVTHGLALWAMERRDTS